MAADSAALAIDAGHLQMLLAVATYIGPAIPGGVFGEDSTPPLQYGTETRYEPRHFSLFRLPVDIDSPELELQVLMADDPDGDGPAETT